MHTGHIRYTCTHAHVSTAHCYLYVHMCVAQIFARMCVQCMFLLRSDMDAQLLGMYCTHTHCQPYLFLLSCKPILVEEIKLPSHLLTIRVHHIYALHYTYIVLQTTTPDNAHPYTEIHTFISMLVGPYNSAEYIGEGHVMDMIATTSSCYSRYSNGCLMGT